eukprot:m.52319 g.52319  ORF g.52319 m.52319 type:complete len:590 (+) comp12692_c1_seq1:165-1934(+)
MLVFVSSQFHAGKTFVVVANGGDTVAHLLGYLFHTFYDMRVIVSPFALRHNGKLLDVHDVLRDVAGSELSDLYLDLDASFHDFKQIWNSEHPPFIQSAEIAAMLHTERKWFARRKKILTATKILLYFSLILSVFAFLSLRWWTGTWPAVFGLVALYRLPQFSDIGGFTISMPPEARQWAMHTFIFFGVSTIALGIVSAINTLYYLGYTCNTDYCQFRGMSTLIVLYLLTAVHLSVTALTGVVQSNFKKKAGDHLSVMLLRPGYISSALENAEHHDKLNATLQFLAISASNVTAFVEHNGAALLARHLRTPSGNNFVLLQCCEFLAHTDAGKVALAEQGITPILGKMIATSDNTQDTVVLSLFVKLFQAIPTQHERMDALQQLSVALQSKGTLLTAEDVSVSAALLHTCVTEQLVSLSGLLGIIDGFLTLLNAVQEVQDCKLLLSALGRVLKEYTPADTETLIDILKSSVTRLQHQDPLVRALAVVIFQLCLKNSQVLQRASEEAELWAALPNALDVRLSSNHQYSCHCAAVTVDIAKKVVQSISQDRLATLRDALIETLQLALCFDLTPSIKTSAEDLTQQLKLLAPVV